MRPGLLLARATARAAEGTGVTVRQVRCLANCSRACSAAIRRDGAWTYVFGGLEPERDVGALIEGAKLFARAADGLMPWRGRPEILKRGLIARVPPIDFEEESEMSALACPRSLHHRHGLSRLGQDDADPPCARQRQRATARRDRQRVRRCRHRRRDPQRLRRRRLPRGQYRRARQWLPVLHRRRRVRAGARPDPRARAASRAHRHRDLRPRAAEAAGAGVPLAGDQEPRHRRRRGGGGRRRGARRRPGRRRPRGTLRPARGRHGARP